MEDLPHTVSRGQTLTADWLNRLLSALRSRELRAGPGIRLSRTPSGTTISVERPAAGSAPAGDVCIARVESAADGVMRLKRILPAASNTIPDKFDAVACDLAYRTAPSAGTQVVAHSYASKDIPSSEDERS